MLFGIIKSYNCSFNKMNTHYEGSPSHLYIFLPLLHFPQFSDDNSPHDLSVGCFIHFLSICLYLTLSFFSSFFFPSSFPSSLSSFTSFSSSFSTFLGSYSLSPQMISFPLCLILCHHKISFPLGPNSHEVFMIIFSHNFCFLEFSCENLCFIL